MVKDKELTKQEPTFSERFTSAVVREFQSTAGDLEAFGPYERRLAQHLFMKIDMQLKDLEAKREGDGLPITWANLNMNKLALDAVHRIQLGLDALIPNHISPIPYFNKREKKYDLDLRVGYAGKDFYRRSMALMPPVDIVYELVYSNDVFQPIKRSMQNPIESYVFEITNPFDRGEIVGGFGYIMYADPNLNKLILVTESDFKKSERLAKGDKFWKNFPVEMRFKTLVHRVCDKIAPDPKKINVAFMAVENGTQEADDAEFHETMKREANQGPVLEIPVETSAVLPVTVVMEKSESPMSENRTVEPEGPDF